ncbi:right-handed parallel beta-helix repeat-containing protein [Spirillospora sp. NPDC052269]
MTKRWLVCLLAGALCGVVPVLANASPAAAATVINVAPGGADVGGCGSTASPCASIPYAYNLAVAGDTIRVQAGTYVLTNPLFIQKDNLHFEGAQVGVDARTRTPGDPGETVITTLPGVPLLYDLFDARANGVSIDGFTFADNGNGAGVITRETFSGFTVDNNIFSNNLKGLAPSSNGVTPSYFRQNLFLSNNNTAFDPGQEGNGVFTYRPLANATFSNNTFQGNDNASINISGGEAAFGTTNNITISDNDMDGEYPVQLVALTDVVVTRNSMVGGWSGVQLSGAVQRASITQNTITDKTRGGVLLYTGIAPFPNVDIDISDNVIERTATLTGRYGVEISNSATNVNVQNNLITDSGFGAIGFTPRGSTTPSTNVTITQNTITGSGDSGISVADGTYTGPMTVNYNRIVDNGANAGLVNNAAAATIDARLNWWGCNDMPDGSGCDHPIGTAAGQIDFQPWLILTISSVPADIAAGQQAQITASLQNDSNGGTPPGPFFQAVTTTFAADPGSVDPSQVLTDALLHAITTWPAGQPRPESICATIDHQTVCLTFEEAGSLSLHKRVDTPGPYRIGQDVRYSYTVTNTGNLVLNDVQVTDDHVTDVTCAETTLAPGAETTCQGTYRITQAGVITNVAVASGTDTQGRQVVSGSGSVTIHVGKPPHPKPPHPRPPHPRPHKCPPCKWWRHHKWASHKRAPHKDPSHREAIHEAAYREEASGGRG